MCGKHPERRVPLLYSCEVVKILTYDLIEVLKRADLLRNGANIEVFLFKHYEFNSIKNLALVTLWDYVYEAKFDPDRNSAVKFESYLRWNIDHLKLGSQAVSNVLDIRKRTAAETYD